MRTRLCIVAQDSVKFLIRQMTANWARRTQLVQFCVDVVDKSVQDKKAIVEDSESTPASQRKALAEIYSDTVKVRVCHVSL